MSNKLCFVIIIGFIYLSCNKAAFLSAQKSEIQQYHLENVDTLVDIGCSDGYFDRQIANYYPNVFFILEDLSVLDYHSKKGHPEIKQSYSTVTEVGKVFKNRKEYPNIENRFKLVIGFEDSIPLANDRFNRILCRRTFHEFKNKEKMASELRRILKPNGKLTIVEVLPKYNGEQDPYCGNPYMTKDEIKKLLIPLHIYEESFIPYKTGELNILTFIK